MSTPTPITEQILSDEVTVTDQSHSPTVTVSQIGSRTVTVSRTPTPTVVVTEQVIGALTPAPVQNLVTSTPESPAHVTVSGVGIKGDPGRDGIDGQQGPPGETPEPFIYETVVPLTITPTIAHALGHYPQVEVTTADGQRVTLFGCTFPTIDTAILTFLSPIVFTATFT